MQKKSLWISYLFIAFFFFLGGCGQHEVIVMKQDVDTNASEMNFLEQKELPSEQQHAYIEFNLIEEIVVLNIEHIPILNQYLQTVNDRRQAIEKMELIPIESNVRATYLLSFACKDRHCSYLMIDQQKEHPSRLLADDARLVNKELSPNQQNILFTFERLWTDATWRNDLLVMDLHQWETIPLQPIDAINDDYILNYETYFLSANWMDSETISVAIPQSIDTTNEFINNDPYEEPFLIIPLQLDR